MATNRILAHRTTIRIFQCEAHLLLCATGDLPDPGYDIDIEQSPLRIFPPEYNIVQCRRPGVFPQMITPYRICRTFPLGDRVLEITVHHGEGTDKVNVEPCEDEMVLYEVSGQNDTVSADVPAIGRSNKLSFDEAFADAVSQLPPSPVADGLVRVKVTEVGGLFGGVAGLHELFVKIEANIDGIS
ncbi:MAG: hypothetical protein AAF412_10570 [Pseudomonadota bacterium]